MTTPFTNLTQAYADSHSCGSYTNEDLTTFQRLLLKGFEADNPRNQLKNLIRHISLPATHPIRSHLWPQLIAFKCGIKVADLLTTTIGSDEDLRPTASTVSPLAGYELSDKLLLPTYNLTAEGQQLLRQLLHRLSADRPDLVYAPQLWPLLGLLLHYHPAGVALNCLRALLACPDMLVQTRRQWLHHCLAMEQLGRSGLLPKRVFKAVVADGGAHEKGQGEANRLQLARWPLHVWKLPLDHVVRVVDCFLVEGRKVLFRAGLVLWKKSIITSVAIPSSVVGSETNMHLLELNTSKAMPASPTAFLRRMFEIRNFGRHHLQEAFDIVEKSLNSGNRSHLDSDLLTQPCRPANNQSTSVNYLLQSSNKAFVHPSQLVNPQQLAILVTSAQDQQVAKLSRPVLLFSSNTHGTSLQTLYLAAAQSKQPSSLLLVRTRSGRSLLGAFCSHRWQANPGSTGYFGNGQCFLFLAGDNERPVVYRWVGLSLGGGVPVSQRQFQWSTSDGLQVGGGCNGGPPGLGLDQQLSMGSSGPSPTFDNPCLADREDDSTSCRGDSCSFSVGVVELIGFEDL